MLKPRTSIQQLYLTEKMPEIIPNQFMIRNSMDLKWINWTKYNSDSINFLKKAITIE